MRIESHGGKIAVEQNPEGGAVFYFALPGVAPGGWTADARCRANGDLFWPRTTTIERPVAKDARAPGALEGEA
jgi:hypothetical protein